MARRSATTSWPPRRPSSSIAITGAIGHHFDVGERWARIADVTVERGVPLRVRGSFLHNRGTLFAAQGSWRLAEGDFSAAVAIRQQALGGAHPDLVASMIKLGKAAPGARRRAAARSRSRAARSPWRGRSFPAESYEVGAARLVRGQALLALGRSVEARADMEAVLDTFERVLGHDHPFLADPMAALGEVALAEGGRPTRRACSNVPGRFARPTWPTAASASRPRSAWRGRSGMPSPADHKHALELAGEARDGYAALPDLAARLTAVEAGWPSIARTQPRPVRGPPRARPAPPPREAPPEDLEPAPL